MIIITVVGVHVVLIFVYDGPTEADAPNPQVLNPASGRRPQVKTVAYVYRRAYVQVGLQVYDRNCAHRGTASSR